jgi:hypothetical protein
MKPIILWLIVAGETACVLLVMLDLWRQLGWIRQELSGLRMEIELLVQSVSERGGEE